MWLKRPTGHARRSRRAPLAPGMVAGSERARGLSPVLAGVRRAARVAPRVIAASNQVARGERGQALVEAAVAFPLLLMMAIALVQFGLYAHASHVVMAAAQEGARVAAAEDGGLHAGVAQAQAVLQAGLGPT